jgi:hypothetical protein
MACEWCSISTESGNHATTADCLDALQAEVRRLRQIVEDRTRFAERARIRDGQGLREEPEHVGRLFNILE